MNGVTGTGQSTTIRTLEAKYPQWERLKSYTTRSPRPEEVAHPERCSYHFVTEEEFKKMIAADAFLEYAWVHQSAYYGTAKKTLNEALERSAVVLKEMEVLGYEQMKSLLPREDYMGIFLLPPDDLSLIIARITKAGERDLTVDEVQKRMESIEMQLEMSKMYDEFVVSEEGKMKEMIAKVEQIILSNAPKWDEES